MPRSLNDLGAFSALSSLISLSLLFSAWADLLLEAESESEEEESSARPLLNFRFFTDGMLVILRLLIRT